MEAISLYAVCWQESGEPWGWAPVIDPDDIEMPESLLPDGPFFWEREEADAALKRIVEWATEREIGRLGSRTGSATLARPRAMRRT